MTGAAMTCRRADATLSALLADPSARPDSHVAECAVCEGVARNALAFERSLGTASAGLVVEPLPPAYRLLPSNPHAGGRSATGLRPRRAAWLGLRAAGSVAAVVAIVAFALSSGGLGENRNGAMTGSGEQTSLPSPIVSPASAASDGRSPDASGVPAGGSDACRAAFGTWMKDWLTAGQVDYTGGSPIRNYDRGDAINTFSACTADELRSLNSAATVARLRPSGKVEEPLIGAFDRTAGVWCAIDPDFRRTRVCSSVLSSGPKPSFYVIQAGDTMSAIAASFGLSLETLLAENPQVANPDQILAGDVLLLPEKARLAWPSGASASPSP